MKRFLKWTAGLAALLVCLVILAGLDRVMWLKAGLPQTSGTRVLDGLTAPVTITRDAHGVPHIFAEQRDDALFALGFAHGQDRMWQMEMGRRTVQGRAAEIFGAQALSTDKFFRALGLYQSAQSALSALSPDTQKALDAYAAGVNAYLATHDGPLAPEFALLFHRPEPWEPADSVALIKLMSLGLSGNAYREALRARMSDVLSPEQLQEFFPPYPGDEPIVLPDSASLYDGPALETLHAQLPAWNLRGASNNWVVDGSWTKSGKPLLANDPHLGLTIPSVWYLAHLHYPHPEDGTDFNIIGATLAGVPSVILGHNGKIAWGFTNTGPDTQDLYVEKVNPDNPDEYLTPTGFEPFIRREESFGIRFQDSRTDTLLRTRHGPIIPHASNAFGVDIPEGHMLSLAWTALDDADATLEAGLQMMHARGWDAFSNALSTYVTPMQSMIYGDTEGNIGLIAPGRVPVRGADHATKGLAPTRGWDAKNDWKEFIPFTDVPKSKNPENGYIATANHKIVGDNYPHYLTSEWDAPYRAHRIEQMIVGTHKHDIETFKAIQMDNVSLMAQEFLPVFAGLAADTQRAADTEEALGYLKDWDGTMAGDSPAPLIFTAFMRELTRNTFADETGDLFPMVWDFRPIFMRHVLDSEGTGSRWCDDVRTPEAETCDTRIEGALGAAVVALRGTYGPDMSQWRWAAAHRAIMRHQPFSFLPILGAMFGLEIESSGGSYTLNRGQHLIGSRTPYANIHGAGYRAVYDLDDLSRSIFVQSTGQSGNPLSPHYAAFAPMWAEGAYIPMLTDPAQIEAAAEGTLELTPAPTP